MILHCIYITLLGHCIKKKVVFFWHPQCLLLAEQASLSAERLIAAANGLPTASTGAAVSVQHTPTTPTAGATATTPARSTTPDT